MRYVLEVCEDVGQACRVLARIPVHAVQNVTLVDRSGDFATVRLSPDRGPEVLTVPIATNHQRRGDWPAYAAAVQTYERERRLLELLQHTGDDARTVDRRVSVSAAVPAALRPRRHPVHGRL